MAKNGLTGAEIVEKRKRPGEQAFKSCCFFCNSGCDCVVYVRDGRVERIEGDPESTTTRGKLCAKGLASKQVLYHPDRLKTPLKRVGERGSGRWEPLSWDLALESIAENLTRIRDRYGPQGVVMATGTSRGWAEVFSRFTNVYKSQWIGPGVAQCFWPRTLGGILTLGGPGLEQADYGHTNCLLVWGVNVPDTWPIKAMGMMEAKSRGAPLIVVDPMLSKAAAKADIWLQLRPGTDCALALGMLHVIIGRGLYDTAFVDRWCLGFKELSKRVEDFNPSKVEAITWVPRDLIVEAATVYASTRPACITQCVSIEQNADTISTCRSLNILAAITGNIDVPGGNIFPMPKGVQDTNSPLWTKIDLWTEEEKSKILGYEQFPLLSGSPNFRPARPTAVPTLAWEAILTEKPYPIKGLYIHGSNALLAYASTQKVREAFQKLEFIAAVDFFHTPTTQLADIVLPAATWLERDFVISNVQVSPDCLHLQQKVTQIGECRSDVTILNEMARRLDLDHFFENEQALCDYILGPIGLTFEEFKKRKHHRVPMKYRKFEEKGFKTPSGKIELASSIVASVGGDPIPFYAEPLESPESRPDLAEKFPFILTTGGISAVFRHTELRNVPWLREIDPHLNAHMNDQSGLQLGLKTGDRVVIESPRGQIRVPIKLHPGIDPRVVQVAHGWPKQENVNLLTDNRQMAKLVSSTCLRGLLCRVYKETSP
ncbi:MAG: molybdopterin-dependent oxidoreductase [Pseudomonadota bacterium]